MYITGHQNDSIHQYELAVGFDLSDVTFLRSQDLSAQSVTPSNIEFNTDGTRMFIIGTNLKKLLINTIYLQVSIYQLYLM